MATIKSYTDISQSKTLSKILPLESADMHYRDWKRDTKNIRIAHVGTAGKSDLPCWSLSALLDVVPFGMVMYKEDGKVKYHFSSKYINTYLTARKPIDACYSMIIKLHELNLL